MTVRVMRWMAGGLLVVVAMVALLFWATTPSAKTGQTLLPPKTNFTGGRFVAYVSPWGGETLAATRRWSRIADAMILDQRTFPANTRITWRWPPFITAGTGPGVWGYNWVGFGNYDGASPEVPVAPIRVRDVKAFRQSFRWSIDNGWGEANVLTEFYLHANATDVDAKRIEIGWFLHLPDETRRFFDGSRLIGTYVDPQGRRWTVRMADRFCMFALEKPGDLPSGDLDMLHALRWLQERKLVTGDEWLWGVAIGAEPVIGMGEMTLQAWRVDRR
jgi:hypothetical protein